MPTATLGERDGDGGAAASPIANVLATQAASGLWEGPNTMRATIDALVELLRADVTTSHTIYGAQVKKAIAALLAHLDSATNVEPALVELAFGVAWLLATGRRTRAEIETATQKRGNLGALVAAFADPASARAYVDRLRAL
jgi:hypothetical protein